MPLMIGIAVLGLVLVVRCAPDSGDGIVYRILAVVAWVAFEKSGVNPVIVGVVIGLAGDRVPSLACRSGARNRSVSGCFANSPRRNTLSSCAAGSAVGDLAQRAAPALTSPPDELRDRPVFRARQRWDPSDQQAAERRAPPHRSRWASWSRTWLESRSASSRLLARVASRPPRSARPVSGPVLGGRRVRGDRVHRLASDLDARLQGCPARRSQSGPARRGAVCLRAHVARGAGNSDVPRNERAGHLRHRRDIIDLAVEVDPDATIFAARRRSGHAGRVRRLRVSVLRPGRGSDPRTARSISATCAMYGVTCRSMTFTRTRNWPLRPQSPPPPTASSGRCTTCCCHIRMRSRYAT